MAALPAISVIIPALNEEAHICGALRCLAGADEILVVDGGSSDATVEIASPHARVLRTEAGRGLQLNAGAREARGDVLLFLHADARLAPGGIGAVRRAMADPRVAGGAFDILYDGDDRAARVFTRFNRWRRGWGIFYGDAGIFCRRAVFEDLGGYPPWPILEDYCFARRLWRAGPLALLDEPIHVSDRRWRNAGLVPTLWSWALIQGLYYAGVSPERLARLYRHIR